MDSTQLRELTTAATGTPPGDARALPGEARRQAHDIVGTSQPPKPHTAPSLPGLPAWAAWSLLAILCILVAAIVWRRAGGGANRRRDRERADATTAPTGPLALEQAAEQAERAGDHALALQLRYRAGLQRLAAVSGLGIGRGSTSGQVDAVLRSAGFARIARVHDRVVFGPSLATATEAADARTSWPTIIREAQRR